MTFEKIYSSMSSAKRGALRAGFANPVFTKLDNGKIAIAEAMIKKAKRSRTASTAEDPVKIFRSLFAENFGKVKRSALIAEAIARGVNKHTAATYYQKLSKM